MDYEVNNDHVSGLVSLIRDDELESKCKLFSEGSKELEELLITLNKNGYYTYACCKGHLDEIYTYGEDFYNELELDVNDDDFESKLIDMVGKPTGYVAFMIPQDKREKIGYILNEMSKLDGSKIDISRYNYAFNGISGAYYFDYDKVNNLKTFVDLLNSCTYSNEIINNLIIKIISNIKLVSEDIDFDVIYNIFENDYEFRSTTYSPYNGKSVNRNINSRKVIKVKNALLKLKEYLNDGRFNEDDLYFVLKRINNLLELVLLNKNNYEYYDFHSDMNYDDVVKFYNDKYGFNLNEFEDLILKYNNYSMSDEDICRYNIYISNYDEYLKFVDSVKCKKLK